jgi:hypothetical protein
VSSSCKRNAELLKPFSLSVKRCVCMIAVGLSCYNQVTTYCTAHSQCTLQRVANMASGASSPQRPPIYSRKISQNQQKHVKHEGQYSKEDKLMSEPSSRKKCTWEHKTLSKLSWSFPFRTKLFYFSFLDKIVSCFEIIFSPGSGWTGQIRSTE